MRRLPTVLAFVSLAGLALATAAALPPAGRWRPCFTNASRCGKVIW